MNESFGTWVPVGRWLVRQDSPTTATIDPIYRAGGTDYPIRYDDGRIAYEWPERCPKYVKEYVAKLLGDNR